MFLRQLKCLIDASGPQPSGSELDDEASSHAADIQSISVTPPVQSVSILTPTATKGKGKGKAPKRATTPGGSDDDEQAAITKQLGQQQQETGQLQGQITQLLNTDQTTAMAHFGSFIGKLGSQIDDRLVDGYYRETLDLTLRTIDRSRQLPPLQVVLAPQQVYQQFVPQQYPQHHNLNIHTYDHPTFTNLQTSGTQQQQQGPVSAPATTHWDNTFVPTAGSSTAVPVRPQSTPNSSRTSMPRISDISQSFMSQMENTTP